MLKFEHFQPGTRIRAYDFEPVGDWRDHIYIEGIVKRHESTRNGKMLILDVEYDSSSCVRKKAGYRGDNIDRTRVGHEIPVPMEVAYFEWDERVTEIPLAIEQKVEQLEKDDFDLEQTYENQMRDYLDGEMIL